ncbi:glycine cleavage system protein H [Aerococcaceae bacterium WGS1372]
MEKNNIWMTEEAGIITIGLTEVLQDEAGDIAYANIAPLGLIEEDDTLLNIEASKAAIELPSPISGEIIERNEEAEDTPSLLNANDPLTNWIVKIKK